MVDYLDCYIRVSTQEQTKGFSLDTQEDIGKKIAKQKKLKFRCRNEGARSSTIHYRVILEELKDDIENGLVKHLWVYDRSRLFRNLNDSLFFRKDYLDKYKVSFYEGELGNIVNFDSLEEKLSYDLISQLQQYENDKRSHKSKQGKRHLLQKGVSNRHYGGTVLFGYKSENGVLSIHKENSKWVVFMFDSILDNKSVMDIKQTLDRNGIVPPRTKNGLWNLGTIQKILGNRAYIGEQTFYDKELKEEFSYSIDPIITRRTFLKVRSEMDRRLKIKDNNKKHFTLFGDFMDCECGNTIGSEVKVGVRKNGIHYDSKNYHCTSKSRQWKYGVKSNCVNKRSMRIELCDDFLLTNIRKVVSDSNLLKDRFKTDVLSKKYEKDKDLNEQTKKLEDKCKRILKKREKTYENIILMETDIMQGRREEKITKGILKKLKNELESFKEETTKTELEIQNLSEEKVWVNWLKKYGDELNTKITNNDNQKDWLNGLIKKIIVIPVIEGDKQTGHKFNIFFHLKVVRDKYKILDSKVRPRKYEIIEGSSKLVTDVVDLRKGRGKKKTLNQGNLGKSHEIKYKHSSEPISNSGVVQKSVFISDEYSQYLCFNIIIGSNNLSPHQEYTDTQQKNYDLIKSLHDSGLGYRKIAQHLNDKGIKTARGNSWVNTQVFSVLKKYRLRNERINNVRLKEYQMEIGKFELKWLKN